MKKTVKKIIENLNEGDIVTICLCDGQILEGIFKFIDGDIDDGKLVLKAVNGSKTLLGWGIKHISKIRLNKPTVKTIKDLTVKVTYRAGYGGVKVPEHVYRGLCEIFDKGGTISDTEANDPDRADASAAFEWLSVNIREGDAMDWEFDIEEFEE